MIYRGNIATNERNKHCCFLLLSHYVTAPLITRSTKVFLLLRFYYLFELRKVVRKRDKRNIKQWNKVDNCGVFLLLSHYVTAPLRTRSTQVFL